MPDNQIRVVTFAVNLPACYNALRYFLRSWKINAGDCYARTRFTVMLPQHPDAECLEVCRELASVYPLDLVQTSAATGLQFQHYWPMSFLDLEFDEEVVIYCPPHTLLSNDVARIVEKTRLEQAILCTGFNTGDNHTVQALPMWFASFPKAARRLLSGTFAAALARCMPAKPDALAYRQVMAVMAQAFSEALGDQKLIYEIVAPPVLCELDDAILHDAGDRADPDAATFFSLTDAPGNRHSWSNIFGNPISLQSFIDDTHVSGAWLYYQRTLRRIHAELGTSAFFQRRTIFKTLKAPYYIFALDYIQQSAGIRALHYLCHALNESGQEAYVSCEKTIAHLRTPVLNDTIMMQHHTAGREPIMVYPEIVPGNPFGAKTVARWLLNKPGLIGGDTSFAEDELIFAFDPLYLADGIKGEILHIPTSDLSLFNNEDNPEDGRRELVCFYAHKYQAQGGKKWPRLSEQHFPEF